MDASELQIALFVPTAIRLCRASSTKKRFVDLQFLFKGRDTMFLAVAHGFRNQGLIDHFVAADRALCEIAAVQWSSVLNPE
jgi:hypothetical protein